MSDNLLPSLSYSEAVYTEEGGDISGKMHPFGDKMGLAGTCD